MSDPSPRDIVERLTPILTRRYGARVADEAEAWPPALLVLDAALTFEPGADGLRLGHVARRAAVVTPIRRFRAAYPTVDALADLRGLLRAEAVGVGSTLGIGAERIARLTATVDVLLHDLSHEPGEALHDERTHLRNWADWQLRSSDELPLVADDDGQELGYDYLRMRLGAPVVPWTLAVTAVGAELFGRCPSLFEIRFGEAIHRAGLSPLTVVQAVVEDLVQGRPLDDAPDADPGGWVRWFEGMLHAVGAHERGEPVADLVGALHRDAPHRPPGAEAALRGDARGVLVGWPAPTPAPEPANVASAWLLLLHLDLAGHAFDVEATGPTAQQGVAALAAAIRTGGAPASARYLAALDALAQTRSGRLGLSGMA